MQLTKAFDRYYRANTRIRSQRTINGYQSVLRLYGEHLGRVPTTDDLNDETVGDWFRARTQQVAASTANSEAASLLALWKWCARKRICEEWPDVRPPERTRRRPKSLAASDVAKLFSAAYATERAVRGVPGNRLWPALLGLFLETAERTGAVLAVQWDQIDFSNHWITYPPETRKNGVDEISHKLTAVCLRDLAALREVQTDAPFAVIKHTRFYEPWHLFCAEAGVADKVTPKTIRKTVASHLPTLEDARRKLGHRSGTTTATYYRDETIQEDTSSELLAKLRNPAPKASRWRWLWAG